MRCRNCDSRFARVQFLILFGPSGARQTYSNFFGVPNRQANDKKYMISKHGGLGAALMAERVALHCSTLSYVPLQHCTARCRCIVALHPLSPSLATLCPHVVWVHYLVGVHFRGCNEAVFCRSCGDTTHKINRQPPTKPQTHAETCVYISVHQPAWIHQPPTQAWTTSKASFEVVTTLGSLATVAKRRKHRQNQPETHT